MKKLILLISIICLMAPAVYSQEPYLLDKVKVTAWSYESKAPVFEISLNDSAQVVTAEWNFPILPVFKSVVLNGDKMAVEVLNDNNYSYELSPEDNILRLSEIESPKEKDASFIEEEKVPESANGFQYPPYTIQQSGNQLTITFDHIVYGSSNYPTQTLEGKCEMIYVKR